jgi:hypothetical protein
MSDLQEGRRLPVFIDEDQWRHAFAAAKDEVEALECAGLLLPQTADSRRIIATRIATAALRAASSAEGDISELPGVSIDEVPPPPSPAGGW